MKRPTGSVGMISDMTPRANDFAEWRRVQENLASAEMTSGFESDVESDVDVGDDAYARNAAPTTSGLQSDVDADANANADADNDEDEYINSLEETKGCAILDSGATVMCSLTLAAEEVQMQRLD